MNDLIYVYCLSTCPPDLDKITNAPGLKCLIFEDFTALVKYVSESEFSEENLKKNLSDIQWLEINAREHIRVIVMTMEQGTVIPFNFGTIYKSEDSLKKFIEDYSGSLIENIIHINEKTEWAVKIYCDRNTLGKQIDELSDESAALEKQIMDSSPGRAFLLKRKKTDLIENEMDRLCQNYGQEFYNEFKILSTSAKLNNLLPKEFTGRKDTMILNATLLVKNENDIDFVTAARVLKNKYAGLGFDLEITGPWPPFSFLAPLKKNNDVR